MRAHWLDSLLSYVLFDFYRPAGKFLPLPLPWVVAKSQLVWLIQSILLTKKLLATHWRTHLKSGIFTVPAGHLHLVSGTSVLNSHPPSSPASCFYVLSNISMTWELFLEMEILTLSPEPLNQKLCGCGTAVCVLTSPPV